MVKKKIRYHPNKWTGVYVYELDELFKGRQDLCFYINFRLGRRLVWEKIGKLSEGYSAPVAAEIRAERVKTVRHGEQVKTHKEIRQERLQRDKSFHEVATDYFDIKGATLKGIVTDRNRYEKHLAPVLDGLHISEITPQVVEDLQKQLNERKPATVWNVLELMRRIINFGYKTNRCPELSFRIDMPVKDNEVIEYLTIEEVNSFLETARLWPARDVGNMLMLAFFTGMRRGEIFKLEDSDVDFEMKLLRIRGPKGKKSMSIGLSVLSEEIIREEMAWRNEKYPDSPYLFPGRNGQIRKDCSAVDRFKKEAGLPPKFRPFHGLRHHFAVTLANSGKFSMNIIADLLTHKNADFTRKKYAQFLPATLTAASNAAANILVGK
ncbi:MAG: site-specific integrase [Desulfocapsaceae bacterium]|nr:site-specific integrase [Desulfocapsaceae bacterium]